jgi:hypothetical protein
MALEMYYCWSHGLSKLDTPAPPVAETKEGHQTSATADKMQGTTPFRLVTERFSSAGLALTQRDAYSGNASY